MRSCPCCGEPISIALTEREKKNVLACEGRSVSHPHHQAQSSEDQAADPDTLERGRCGEKADVVAISRLGDFQAGADQTGGDEGDEVGEPHLLVQAMPHEHEAEGDGAGNVDEEFG